MTDERLAEWTLALAPLLVLPLGVRMLVESCAPRLRPLALVVLAAALLAGVGHVAGVGIAPGDSARVALLVPYGFLAVCCGLLALARFATRSCLQLDELALDAALLCVPVGAGWLFVYGAGTSFRGFSGLWALLTALHFHFAGFGCLLVTGMVGRLVLGEPAPRAWRVAWRVAAVALLLALPMVAIGIDGSRAAEVLGVGMYVLGLPLLATLALRTALRAPGELRASRWGLALATVVPVATTVLVVGWALARPPWVTLPTMLRFHGVANAALFVAPAVLALSLATPRTRARVDVPFSRLYGRGRIGPRFFDALRPAGEARRPTGLSDDLGRYARADFDPGALHPEVRRFYERTADYDLEVVPAWRPGFRLAGRLWQAFGERVGQLGLPRHEPRPHEVRGEIVPLDDARDGRRDVRGWIRTWRESGRPIYVAAYAEHEADGVRYMNIAFPLPGSNLTSVLRLDHAEQSASSLRLTSRAVGTEPGDQGVYLANPLLPVRLPLNETIQVWSTSQPPAGEPAEPDAAVVLGARHRMWLCGLEYLELRYRIRRRAGPEERPSA